MNKITKNMLRIWISITSMMIFAMGWITLAHAQKPAPLTVQITEAAPSAAPADSLNLEPVPSLEDLTQSSKRPTISQPSVNFNMPRLRTRGS